MHLEQPMTARGGHNAGDVDCDYYIYHSSLLRDVAEFLSCRTRTWTCAIVIYVWYDTVASRGKGVNHLSRYEYRPSVVSRTLLALRLRDLSEEIYRVRTNAMTRKYPTRPSLLSLRRDKTKKRKKEKKEETSVTTMFPDVIRYTNLTRNKLCFVVFISLFDARQIQRDYVKHNDARVMIT